MEIHTVMETYNGNSKNEWKHTLETKQLNGKSLETIQLNGKFFGKLTVEWEILWKAYS